MNKGTMPGPYPGTRSKSINLNYITMNNENFLLIKVGTLMPKFNLLCGKDDLRPAMAGVLLTQNNVVATDAHRMAWGLTSELFDIPEECVIPENFIIPAKAWAELAKKGATGMEICEDSVKIFDKNMDYKAFKLIIGMYPNWEAVIPKDEVSIDKIGLAPKILRALCEFYPSANMKLTFTGEARAVLIHWMTVDINLNGLIMPVMLNV